MGAKSWALLGAAFAGRPGCVLVSSPISCGKSYFSGFKSPKGVEFRISVSTSKGQDKMAVLFLVKNNSPTEPWSLMEARLITADGREDKPFALRASREHWGPGGESGQIAVIVDASAFDSKTGPDQLVLELFRHGDGLRQAWVFLDQHILRE